MISNGPTPDGTEQVVLVDGSGRDLGVVEKGEAHRAGLLHRAFSVFVFNREGDLLLQQRAPGKYHSAGLWSNTCCGHPRPGEEVRMAAARRLFEEMGIRCPLHGAFHFTYRAELAGGMVEHEIDHVFVGRADGAVDADPVEVMATRWIARADLAAELRAGPEAFTAWLPLCVWRAWDLGAKG